MSESHTHWEEHYGAKPRVWSGRVNTRLAEVVPRLSGIRALDLGCGEGADAIWLAEHGWQVVAVDVSTTALARAAEDAETRGVLSRIDFQQHDLERTFPEGSFDLVSAQFFHTPLEMDRTAVLRRAADAVARAARCWSSTTVRHRPGRSSAMTTTTSSPAPRTCWPPWRSIWPSGNRCASGPPNARPSAPRANTPIWSTT